LTETKGTKVLDDGKVKTVHRSGESVMWGKGQHACIGEKLGRGLVDLYWQTILGEKKDLGYDIEIIHGIEEGKGIDGVGIEAAWVEENLGTPFEKGGPLLVQIKKRTI